MADKPPELPVPTCYVRYHIGTVMRQAHIQVSDEPDASGIRWIRSPEPFRCLAARAYAANLHLAMLIELAQRQRWPISDANADLVFAIFDLTPAEADALFRSWGCAPGTYTVSETASINGLPEPEAPPPAKPSDN